MIPACDVPLEVFESLVEETGDIEGIGGYKIPATSGRKGWERWNMVARKHTEKPLIYDHQKAGTDIPDTGKLFMKELSESGFNAVILFPLSGPKTERAWIEYALNSGLNVMVGGWMTHGEYAVSEGGWITNEGILNMYRIAARMGINNFVLPGTKPNAIRQIRETIGEEGCIDPVLYGPGLGIGQGGDVAEAKTLAGDKFHAIVGRGIYEAQNKRAAVLEHYSQLK